jgi:hypothetical protein
MEKYFIVAILVIIIQILIGFVIMFAQSRLTGGIIALTGVGFLTIILLIILYESFYTTPIPINDGLSSKEKCVELDEIVADNDEIDQYIVCMNE